MEIIALTEDQLECLRNWCNNNMKVTIILGPKPVTTASGHGLNTIDFETYRFNLNGHIFIYDYKEIMKDALHEPIETKKKKLTAQPVLFNVFSPDHKHLYKDKLNALKKVWDEINSKS